VQTILDLVTSGNAKERRVGDSFFDVRQAIGRDSDSRIFV